MDSSTKEGFPKEINSYFRSEDKEELGKLKEKIKQHFQICSFC